MGNARFDKVELSEKKELERLIKKEVKEQKKQERVGRKLEKIERRAEYRENRKISRRHSSSSNRSKRMKSGMWWSLLNGLIQILHIIVDKILNGFLGWYLGDRKVCPPLKDNLYITMSAIELARMIRQKELKSEELVRAYITRINQTQPLINFVTDGPFDEAINEAKQLDDRIARGQISEDEFSEKPFLGVPFTSKDSTAAKGKLHTFGIRARKNIRAKEDAECVRLIKEAGAILIAVTNVPEINRWQETRNMVYGTTNNPYDPRRTVGGSSGGEAAAIATCSTGFGLGTDIGGSIRMPAFFCGIFGHKPTGNIVNTRGCTLRTGNESQTMVVAGPMSRYASDLLPLLKVLAGPKNCIALQLDDPVDLTKLKYFYISHNGELRNAPVSSELKNAMNHVITHFSDLANEPVRHTTLPGTEHSIKMWRYWMTQESQNFAELLGNGVPVNPIFEIFKKIAGQSDFTFAALYPLIDSILPQEKEKKIKEITKLCEEKLYEILGDDGILFYPSAPATARFHYHYHVKMYNFSYWALGNVLKVPVTQVPLGLDSNRIPLGIQVIAGKNRDRHCLAVAEEIGRVFGGWVPPFEINN